MAELYGRSVRATDETELYRSIARWLPELIPADRASVTLMVGIDQLEVLGLHGEEGLIPLGKRLPVAMSGPGIAVATKTTQRWTVHEYGDRFEVESMVENGLHAFINAPLIVQDHAVGALSVARSGDIYDENQGRLLEEIAKLVSVNLERFQSLAHTRQQLTKATKNQQRLELLAELGRRLSAAVSDDDAFAAVADLASGVLPLDRLSLALPDPEDETFRIVALQQGGAPPVGLEAGAVIPLYPSGVGDVYRTGKAHYVPDMAASEYAEHRHLAHEAGLQSGLSVPVRAKGEVVAVLNSAAIGVDAYEVDDRTAAEAIATVLGETLERIRSRNALAVRERELAGIVDNSPLLMMTIDDDGAILQLSEFGASQLGYKACDLRGKPLATLYPPDQQHELQLQLADLALQPVDSVSVWESQMINANDVRVRVRHSGRRLAVGSSASTILVCEDVTQLVELADKLAHEATHDPLTGLVNRREFDRRLSAAIGAGDGPLGSVLFIDIDQFKIVNDTSGHHAGDALLVELAATLGGILQREDTFARLGGDEFAVLLPGCSLANAIRVAERLRTAANDIIFIWDNRTFGTSLSVGVAAIDPSRPGTDDVMGRADAACYDAKNEGRNKVSVASGQQTNGRSTRPDGEWGSRLRDALRDGGLSLVSQRIAAVEGLDERNRLELLVRLDNGGGELLPAALFIPAAERLGIITEIDQWVVTQVAELLSSDEELWPELDFVAVNLSARSIESDAFLDHLVATLATPGLDPSKLLFEITETAALSQFSKAVRFIETVSAVGCRFALDDFGAGFSTFHYLKRLPVDVLKIDGSLVRDLTTDPIDRSIVRSIVDVADSLGMKTVAEFVDDQSTVDWLEKLGVDYAQGYGIGRPAPIEAPALTWCSTETQNGADVADWADTA